MSYTQLKPCWVLINNRHVPSSLWNTRDIRGKPHQELGHTDLVFGVMHLPNSLWYTLPHTLSFPPHDNDNSDSVLSSPQILKVPLLLLANKQDSPDNLSATEIRHDYEEWDQRRRESARRRFGEDEDAEMERKLQRIANLDVMGVSALDG